MDEYGSVRGTGVGQDGSVVLGISGDSGHVATKLDADGTLLWHSQVGLREPILDYVYTL